MAFLIIGIFMGWTIAQALNKRKVENIEISYQEAFNEAREQIEDNYRKQFEEAKKSLAHEERAEASVGFTSKQRIGFRMSYHRD